MSPTTSGPRDPQLHVRIAAMSEESRAYAQATSSYGSLSSQRRMDKIKLGQPESRGCSQAAREAEEYNTHTHTHIHAHTHTHTQKKFWLCMPLCK